MVLFGLCRKVLFLVASRALLGVSGRHLMFRVDDVGELHFVEENDLFAQPVKLDKQNGEEAIRKVPERLVTFIQPGFEFGHMVGDAGQLQQLLEAGLGNLHALLCGQIDF